MNARLPIAVAWALALGSALALELFDAHRPLFLATATQAAAAAQSAEPAPVQSVESAPVQSVEPAAVQSVEPATPTVTPLPPPIVPPPDAAGINATTAPIGPVSPLPQPTLPDTSWIGSADSSSIAIEVHGGRAYVPVVVNGHRREFVLTTMSPTVIDASLTGSASASGAVVRTLQVGNVRFNGLRVSVTRFGPYSATYLGDQIDGLLGTELFAHYPVTIDYPVGAITIYRTEEAALRARAGAASILPLQMLDGIPAITCAVDATSAIPCLIDLNSSADIALPPNHEAVKRFDSHTSALTSMREAEPGQEVLGAVMRARTLTIGTLTVRRPLVQVPASEHATPPFRGARPRVGGGIVGRFALTIDELGACALISGVEGTIEGTEFDRSGLWLVWRDGMTVVRSVQHGTPADTAGIRGGDVIIAIDGKPATDLGAAQSALVGTAGARLLVTYAHSGRRKNVVLTLRTLI